MTGRDWGQSEVIHHIKDHLASIKATSDRYRGKGGSLVVGEVAPYFPFVVLHLPTKNSILNFHVLSPLWWCPLPVVWSSHSKLSNISIYPHFPKNAQSDCSPNFSMLLVYLLTLPSDGCFTQTIWHEHQKYSETWTNSPISICSLWIGGLLISWLLA